MTKRSGIGQRHRSERPIRLLVCGAGGERGDALARIGADASGGAALGEIDDADPARKAYRPAALDGRPVLVAVMPAADDVAAADVVAAAVADVAVLVLEAGSGISGGTRRLAALLSLLAVPALVLVTPGADGAEETDHVLSRGRQTFETATEDLALPKAMAVLPIPSAGTTASSGTMLPQGDVSLGALLATLPPRRPTGEETRSPSLPRVVDDDKGLPPAADHFSARLLWLHSAPMVPGRDYVLQTIEASTPATVTTLRYRLEPASGARISATTLAAGELGICNLSLRTPIPLAPLAESAATGCFTLCERLPDGTAGATLGAGTIRFALRRSRNVAWQALDVTKAARAAAKGQKPAVIWLTGLSGSGKSTIANGIDKRLHHLGCHTYLLDGDNVRHGLNRDLGFTEADRVENIRRVAEVARLFADAGLIVVVSLISPFCSERRMARDLMAKGEFVEVFVDTPIEECTRRDPKGLYAKAMRGEIRNFTGIDSPYEPPLDPDLRLTTMGTEPDDLVAIVEAHLRERGIIA